MKIDWKRQLTSRKCWMTVAGFATSVMLIVMAGITAENKNGGNKKSGR